MILGAGAGLLDLLKLKGIHNAMHSGIVAAECIVEHINNSAQFMSGNEIKEYEISLRKSTMISNLKKIRNMKNSFKFGLYPALFHIGFSMIIGVNYIFYHKRNIYKKIIF